MKYYNVTFVSTYWTMSTSVVIDSMEDTEIIEEADSIIWASCGLHPEKYANVDIDVEYYGEDSDA